MSTDAPRGQRKARATFLNSVIILAGFALSCWMEAPTEMFVAFVVGVTGNTTAFMWGNSNEHKSTKAE